MILLSRRAFLFGSAALCPYLYMENKSLALRRYLAPVPGLPRDLEGFTILHLTDLHDKEYGRGGEELLDLVQDEAFDMVALTGDLVSAPRPRLTPALDLVHALKHRRVFSVSGNHDWDDDDGEEVKARLADAGARVLANSSATIHRGSSRILIVGVEDPVTGRARLEQALPREAHDGPRILLSHSPQLLPQAARCGFDLLLAGHTHGGQVRLPFVGAPFVPGMGIFPTYDYGMYRRGKTTMVVNAGLGESWAPVRVNIRPEAVLVTLVSSLEERG